MSVTSTKDTRSEGVKKMIARLKLRPADPENGLIKVGEFKKTFDQPMTPENPSFWNFCFQGCEQVKVLVYFDPRTEKLTLIGSGRCLTDFTRVPIGGGRTFPIEYWPYIAAQECHIDDIVDNDLKQPLMVALGFKPAPTP
ncbi:MAG: hypothetical protein WBB33_00560 [Candidatus Saccharimonadales bacterium]